MLGGSFRPDSGYKLVPVHTPLFSSQVIMDKLYREINLEDLRKNFSNMEWNNFNDFAEMLHHLERVRIFIIMFIYRQWESVVVHKIRRSVTRSVLDQLSDVVFNYHVISNPKILHECLPLQLILSVLNYRRETVATP